MWLEQHWAYTKQLILQYQFSIFFLIYFQKCKNNFKTQNKASTVLIPVIAHLKLQILHIRKIDHLTPTQAMEATESIVRG